MKLTENMRDAIVDVAAHGDGVAIDKRVAIGLERRGLAVIRGSAMMVSGVTLRLTDKGVTEAAAVLRDRRDDPGASDGQRRRFASSLAQIGAPA